MSRFLRRFAPPVAFVLTAFAVKVVLRGYVLPEEGPFVLFFSAVLLSAWWGGLAAGVVAAVLSAVIALARFIHEPGEPLRAHEVVRAALFMAEGFFVSLLAEALNRARQKESLALGQQRATTVTLAEQEERFRGTFEQAAVGMAHVALDGRWLRVNDRLCGITGYSRDELLATTFLDVTHPDDVRLDLEQAAALADGRIDTYSMEKRYVRKNGSVVWINLTGSMARTPEGQPLYFIVVVEDIDARRRIEDELRAAHQRLTFHMNNSPLGALVWDRDFRVMSWSAQCERIFGWTADEVLGKHPSEFAFVYEEDAFAVADVMTRLQSGTPRNTHRNRNYTRDGAVVTCEWYNSVLFDEAGMPESIQSLVLDVTDRARAERELRELTETLEQRVEARTAELRRLNADLAARELELSRSNAELESFAYVASHDLQEPLRMVASYTQLLGKRYRNALDDDAREFIDYAVNGVRRMQRLINDLLAYSRIDRRGGEMVHVPALTAVRGALDSLHAAIEESNAVVEIGDLPHVEADESQLAQLFQNLIGNAIKFRGTAPLRIAISAARNGHEWEFTVRDNGLGIDPAFGERIFVVFQRLHTQSEYPGTGIGLAICKKVVERHGGRIWLDPSVRDGAAFKFTLPVREVVAPVLTGAA